MRIVGGRLRGRPLAAPPGRATRPTSDRARQALFNILAHGGFGGGGKSVVVDALVLDAFAGTGALGLEALSRGAASAVFIESDDAAVTAIRRNIAAFGLEAETRIVVADAAAPPPRPGDLAPATLVLLDPPYAPGLAAESLAALARTGWLASPALCVVEHAAVDSFVPPAAFEEIDRRRYGKAEVIFLRFRRRADL